MGEPSFMSQPPGAQHQNELLRAGEGVAGQLGPESAPVGFQLCVSNPLQGRRREARREKGRGTTGLQLEAKGCCERKPWQQKSHESNG